MNSGPEPESESTEPLSAGPPRQEDVLGRRIGAALIDLALMVAVFAILAATIGESTVEGGELSLSSPGPREPCTWPLYFSTTSRSRRPSDRPWASSYWA